MRKHLLLLTFLGLSASSLSANSYSWTGLYVKFLPAYSNLKLNYSGDTPYAMNLTKNKSYDLGYTYISNKPFVRTLAEKISTGVVTLDCMFGLSQEISDSFGLIGELGSNIGRTTNFIGSEQALINQMYFAVGLFYHQPSFRIHGMGGLGFGKDIFGYPNVIESLEIGGTVSVSKNENLLNSRHGITYRGSIGFDYKLTQMILLGVSYTYTRSKTNVELKNEETLYISNHSFAAMIGLHI